MALREVSIALGILAGSAGIANSGYGLYRTFIVQPNQNEEYNLQLLNETPLLVESVEIQPDPTISMRVDVTVKIFRSGDILVESGQRRQFIPFLLHASGGEVPRKTAGNILDFIMPVAQAAETTVIDGVTYAVDTIRYTETMNRIGEERIRRIRIYSDGTVETAIIDIRSNKVLESQAEKRELSDAERSAIEKSPYRKKIFKPVP